MYIIKTLPALRVVEPIDFRFAETPMEVSEQEELDMTTLKIITENSASQQQQQSTKEITYVQLLSRE